MPLTDEQANAVDLFKSSRSLKIAAFAGTGKTTTLTELAKSTRNAGLYLAFNKVVAAEARSKFPETVDCRTTHSIAFRAAPGAFSRESGKLTDAVQGNRVSQVLGLEELAFEGVTIKPRSLGYLVTKTVQRFCQSGSGRIQAVHVPLSGKLAGLTEAGRAEFQRYIAELAATLWAKMTSPGDPMPLGHDGYLKIWSLSQPRLHYDFILLDEAQDTNGAVLSVLRHQECQRTLVGDRHQQIYEWRGAVNAMEKVRTEAESHLTQSFRFGPAIAEAATDILRMLNEPRSVTGNPARLSAIHTQGTPDAVLCRTNAGVIAVVIDTLQIGQTPHVVGGVHDLMRMVDDVSRLKEGYPAETTELFGFASWLDVIDFSSTDEGQSLRAFVNIIEEHGEGRVRGALERVELNEVAANVTVSTGHKAKGREWDTVRLHTDFEPKKYDKSNSNKPVMNEEEIRLLYVAATRPKVNLIAPSALARLWGLTVREEPRPQTLVPVSPKVAPTRKPHPRLPEGARVVSASPPVVRSTDVGRPKLVHPEHPPRPSNSSDTAAAGAAAGGIISAIIALLLG